MIWDYGTLFNNTVGMKQCHSHLRRELIAQVLNWFQVLSQLLN